MKEEDKKEKPSQTGKASRAMLESLRLALLGVHKSLVDSERVQYEKTMGKITSPNHFLKLLTDDPWFAWLSPLSQLIVSIDESLDSKEEPLTALRVEALVKESRRLLVATETGSGFSKHYYEALQRDPDVVMAHSEVAKVLRS